MSGRVGHRKRLVCVSAANLRQKHLYLTGHADFFPADAFGPPSSKTGMGNPVRLDVEGIAEPVFTDIPTDARTGKPRRFFRKRAWVGKFFARHSIKPGDTIAIERIGARRFRVVPFAAKDERECATTFDSSREPEGTRGGVGVQFRSGSRRRDGLLRAPTSPGPRQSDTLFLVKNRQHQRARKRAGVQDGPRFAEFFAGIGLVRMGLEARNWNLVYANDIDPEKQAMYEAHFGNANGHFDLADVHSIDGARLPDVELATASFPCTDLSLAGARLGFKGKQSSAFWGFVSDSGTRCASHGLRRE